eukprot:m.27573 g.27573  ORF g.27573 m.27573 type:complete len:486 (+) comp4436_c0_seq1:168-1625(+)
MCPYWVYLALFGVLYFLVKYFFASRRDYVDRESVRVAVVGGGIAGTSAAWSLRQDGFKNITIFEKVATLGGNARVQQWPTSPPVTSGLSVLAWPDIYFHNYNNLLAKLGIDTTMVNLKFFVKDSKRGTFVHGKPSSLQEKLSTDIARWNRMVSFIRSVNGFLHRSPYPSLYDMSVLNPFNIITLRQASRLFGVSAEYWNTAVVPIYSSTFLTAKLDCVPAVIAPVIHDLIPLDAPSQMRTWCENSSLVFKAMTEGITVRTGVNIEKVLFNPNGTIVVKTESGETEFDRIIFACSADAALSMMDSPSALEKFALGKIGYSDDDDTSFIDGRIHSDPTVIPAEHRQEVLREFANYIEINGDRIENTFVISSWVPAGEAVKDQNKPFLVTYNSERKIDPATIQGVVSNKRCHPHMSLWNLIIAAGLIRFIQGRRGAYYCGSFATPGNGHDLSLLSGLIVAHTLGARYPFPDNKNAATDFSKLRTLMGL